MLNKGLNKHYNRIWTIFISFFLLTPLIFSSISMSDSKNDFSIHPNNSYIRSTANWDIKWGSPNKDIAEEVWGLANPQRYVPHDLSYYKTVIKAIKQRL